MIVWIILGVVALVAVFLWATYNGLVKLKIRVDEAWSDITVQLKRRVDLIPNHVNTVKGYAAHERSELEKNTKARGASQNASGVKETEAGETMLEGALKSLIGVGEADQA